jgi:hypothetical protein
LHDALEALELTRGIGLEPVLLDHAAALRGRRLLILASEVIFPERGANALHRLERLALGMQHLAGTAREARRAEHRLDFVRLIFLGDRWEAYNLPRLLLEDMADEIIFMQTLHDQHDGAVLLIVETAIEGVVIPLIGGVAARSR